MVPTWRNLSISFKRQRAATQISRWSFDFEPNFPSRINYGVLVVANTSISYLHISRAKIRKILHQIGCEADHRQPSKKYFTSISACLLRTLCLAAREY